MNKPAKPTPVEDSQQLTFYDRHVVDVTKLGTLLVQSNDAIERLSVAWLHVEQQFCSGVQQLVLLYYIRQCTDASCA